VKKVVYYSRHMPSPTRPGTPALLRVLNDRTALGLLLENGPTTRNDLARLSGLSKPTAAEMIRRLEEAGLIAATGESSSSRGPAAVLYSAVTDRAIGVAIDVQPLGISSTVVDATGATHPVVFQAAGDAAGDPDAATDLARAIDAACAAASCDPESVTVVCVGIQGSVEPRTDDLVFTDELPGWPRHRVTATLSEALGADVHVENDANLVAIAERREGAGHDASTFALLWMGNGLGLALDLGGTVHRGAAGGAGEIGYIGAPVDAAAYDPDARLVDDLVTSRTIELLAARQGITGDGLDELLDAIAGHPQRLLILDELAPRVGLVVLPALAVVDPERIILHGPIGIAFGDDLATRVESWLEQHSRWSTPVSGPSITETPVLHGARHVLIDAVRQALVEAVAHLPSPGDDPPELSRTTG
jgi:predicted NBD/HSP70 family sugar kinase